MRQKLCSRFITFLLIFLSVQARATTWNEPWADDVIRGAKAIVFAEVTAADKVKGITLRVTKTLCGDAIPDKCRVTAFSAIDLSSSSGGGPEFRFEKGLKGYFFISTNHKGEYCLPTPTSGCDPLYDKDVMANFRHSCQRSIVPVEIYEMAMRAIFLHYHKLDYDINRVHDLLSQALGRKPAGFEKEDRNIFFMQHVALELIHHLDMPGYYEQILPFFNDTNNMHNRISAARALRSYHTEACMQLLIQKIKSDPEKDDHFVSMVSVWSLQAMKPAAYKAQLMSLIPLASDEENSFGIGIMDPRVGTYLPSVKEALETLLKTL